MQLLVSKHLPQIVNKLFPVKFLYISSLIHKNISTILTTNPERNTHLKLKNSQNIIKSQTIFPQI